MHQWKTNSNFSMILEGKFRLDVSFFWPGYFLSKQLFLTPTKSEASQPGVDRNTK